MENVKEGNVVYIGTPMDLNHGNISGEGPGWTYDMWKYAGKRGTVTVISRHVRVKFNDGYAYWYMPFWISDKPDYKFNITPTNIKLSKFMEENNYLAISLDSNKYGFCGEFDKLVKKYYPRKREGQKFIYLRTLVKIMREHKLMDEYGGHLRIMIHKTVNNGDINIRIVID